VSLPVALCTEPVGLQRMGVYALLLTAAAQFSGRSLDRNDDVGSLPLSGPGNPKWQSHWSAGTVASQNRPRRLVRVPPPERGRTGGGRRRNESSTECAAGLGPSSLVVRSGFSCPKGGRCCTDPLLSSPFQGEGPEPVIVAYSAATELLGGRSTSPMQSPCLSGIRGRRPVSTCNAPAGGVLRPKRYIRSHGHAGPGLQRVRLRTAGLQLATPTPCLQ